MFKIAENIGKFLKALKCDKCLSVSAEGEFFVTYHPLRLIKAWLGWDRSSWIDLSREFRRVLWHLESIPVYFHTEGQKVGQLADFGAFIETGELLLRKLITFKHTQALHEKASLERLLIGLLYRLEAVNGGLSESKQICQSQYEALCASAAQWKEQQVVFHDHSLSTEDEEILRETCRYPRFVTLALQDSTLLEMFFTWVLRDRISVRPFIEYPYIQEKLNLFQLNGRIGRMGGDLLKISKVQVPEDAPQMIQKILTLPFEGKDISILNDQRCVVFRGNYVLSILDVYHEFARKVLGESNLEFLREGFINWNAFRWGWWDEDQKKYQLVDLEKEGWWKELPTIEVLTLKQVREKFGPHLDGRQWSIAAIATRQRANLDFEGAHAYSSIAIPIGQGRYAVYAFGKYSVKFPQDLLRAFLNIGQTSEATIACPDENVFYTHRQRSHYCLTISEKQGLAYLESVKKDMLIARAGNLVYQIESENCAKWAHQKIESIVGAHRIPNVFQMPFLRSQPNGVMLKLFDAIKSLPDPWPMRITLGFHFFLGGYKGLWIWEEGKRSWKSLIYHPFWDDTVIYHPSMLHKQQEIGLIRRSVPQGVTFSKEVLQESYHDLYHKMVIFGKSVLKACMKCWIVVLICLGIFFPSESKGINVWEEAFHSPDSQLNARVERV